MLFRRSALNRRVHFTLQSEIALDRVARLVRDHQRVRQVAYLVPGDADHRNRQLLQRFLQPAVFGKEFAGNLLCLKRPVAGQSEGAQPAVEEHQRRLAAAC